jgi:hypothetical protein
MLPVPPHHHHLRANRTEQQRIMLVSTGTELDEDTRTFRLGIILPLTRTSGNLESRKSNLEKGDTIQFYI